MSAGAPPPPWLAHLRDLAAAREAAGLRRTLHPRPQGDGEVLDLASNDYLGLARDKRVIDAAIEATQLWGAGSTGSRLVTGTTELHTTLERELAAFTGAVMALVFSSGYLANLGAVTALTGADCTVISDAGNHASIVDACRLSRATVVVTEHRDVGAVEVALARRTTDRALVVTDAVFSVDGERAPLLELHAVARRHGALLIVDEAHALGVIGSDGRGGAHAAGIAGQPDVVLTVTLSKALGAQGGAVLAHPDVVDHLVNTARPFIFDTALAPSSAGAALAALRVLRAEPGLVAAVRHRAVELAAAATTTGSEVSSPDAAVVSVLIGDADVAVAAAKACLDRGVRVGCFRPPSVPDGRSRLRLTARADLSDADLDRARSAFTDLTKIIRDVGPATRRRVAAERHERS
jgi:8-amino-7-oxononanoate synthase